MNAVQPFLSDLGRAALDYAARGWPVFPVKPGAKEPMGGRGHLDATCDLDQVARWWAAAPEANIGLHLAAAGLVAVDADTYKPDCQWVNFITGRDLPPTLVQRSARGGTHYIFKADPDVSYAGHPCDGADTKHQGYILLEPSRFAGGTYRFETDDDPAPVPAWVPVKGAALHPTVEVARDNTDRLRDLLSGVAAHDNSRDLVASLVAMGVPPGAVRQLAEAALLAGLEPGVRRDDRVRRLDYHVATATAKFAPPGPARQSQFFPASDLHGRPVPPREWLVPGLIPHKNVTLFSGDGGTGKSLLALQLAVASGTGRKWINKDVTPGRTIYLSAEDDEDELHRRLFDILAAERLGFTDLHKLTLRSLAGEDALLAVETAVSLAQTALFAELDKAAAAEPIRLIVLDTLADLYPANENERAKVRQFVGILRGLALKRNCAVLLLGHPSLSGLMSGAGTSGSTAWNNSVRSRLYLERIEDGGYETDPDLRKLTTKKANYGRIGGEIAMRWTNGIFVPEDEPHGVDAMAQTAKAERVFLKLLRQFTDEGRRVSHGGPKPACKQFSEHPDREGVNKKAFQTAMNMLMTRKVVRIMTEGPPSRQVNYLQEVSA